MATLWLRCRHLVIDPCNRMPGHLPRSDGWLNSPKERRRRTKTKPHPVCWANNIQQSGCGSKPPNELSIIIY